MSNRLIEWQNQRLQMYHSCSEGVTNMVLLTNTQEVLLMKKERYYLYWKIAECMESDMVNLQSAVDIKNGRIPDCEPTLVIPEESEYFDLDNRVLELEVAA